MLRPRESCLSRNNFDLLRLLLAGTVCLVHAADLSGFEQLSLIPQVLSSAVAVKAFFVVSGFLIFMSFERSSSLSSYTSKRVRRIYPAYFSVVVLCAITLAIISSKGIGEYFSLEWIKFLSANLLFLNFLHPTLPGVFEGNRIAAVNGALWTLKIEVMFYLTVPIFVLLFRKFGRLRILTLSYCLSVAYAYLMTAIATRTGSGMYMELARQLPGQLSYFMSGALLYYFLPWFERRLALCLVSAMSILAANMLYPLSPLEPIALAIVVIAVALFPYVGNFGKYGDFSYGVYILHFPTIQCLLHLGWFKANPAQFLTAVVMLTAAGAVAMWHLVEKRFLLRNSHYVSALSPHSQHRGAAEGSARP